MSAENTRIADPIVQEPTADTRNAEGILRYRAELKTLQQALEAASALRERGAGLEQRASELRLESAALLDSDGTLEKETTLATTLSVLEAKLSRASERLREAEDRLSDTMQAVRSRFATLHRVYRLWCVEREKTRLLSQMVEGCPQLSLDQVVLHLKTIAALSALEITAENPETLLEQAQKLLEALEAEPEFILPAPADSVAANGSAAAGSEETDWTGPWDPLDGSIDIQAEIAKLLAEEPGLTLATFNPRLRAKFPHLYKRRAKVVEEMQEPPSGLATGVYEQEQGGSFKLLVEPIGSTRET